MWFTKYQGRGEVRNCVQLGNVIYYDVVTQEMICSDSHCFCRNDGSLYWVKQLPGQIT